MRVRQFDHALLAEHRQHMTDGGGRDAFDALVASAVAAKDYNCAPAWHGDIRVFRYEDPVTGDRPFEFIVNRKDILFYFRTPGFRRIDGGGERLRAALPWAAQNPAGEWTIRIRTRNEAAQLNQFLFDGTAVRSEGTGKPWSAEEIDVVVADYFQMLRLELQQQGYSKAAHNRALLPKLRGRSKGSIELKHQNISAILVQLRAPWIIGYKPQRNYQTALYDAVASRLEQDHGLDEIAAAAVEQAAVAPNFSAFSGLLEEPPEAARTGELEAEPYRRPAKTARKDYLGIEARNRSLGLAGEEFVVGYERHRLRSVGAKKLSNKVEHVSQTQGDCLGYDVLSFDADGRERLIEVKTTAFGREAPFYVSRTELALSRAEPDAFRLYRLFEFRRKPRMFELTGPVDARCLLDPVSYLARFV